MQSGELVRMANQIASYFGAYPEAEAVPEIASHIRSFWDPRMRSALLAHVETGGEGLDPLVLKAVRRLLQPSDGV
ncbi:formate dehydrogenase subunit delta [Oleisolibacter albus]|uniref:formate dehydrogenase subunit delta n=1 Tax=Oleisolibacter albus TaxID=2171757 RepID=UPI000DF4BC78|nr:formate dehydrogenase subunit delta [Oleisolibacter albus]